MTSIFLKLWKYSKMNMSLDAQSSTKPHIRMAEEGVINRNFKVMNSSDSDQDEVKYINQIMKL